MADIDLKRAFKEFILGDEQFYSLLCTVESVNENDFTCNLNPVDGSAQIINVKLHGNIGDDKGLIMIPAIDSFVLATFTNKNSAFISLYSEIVKILINVGESAIEITDGRIMMNGGENYGLVKVEALTDRLKAIEEAFNTLLTTFKIHVHPVDIPHAITSVITPTPSQVDLPLTEQIQIENTKVQH